MRGVTVGGAGIALATEADQRPDAEEQRADDADDDTSARAERGGPNDQHADRGQEPDACEPETDEADVDPSGAHRSNMQQRGEPGEQRDPAATGEDPLGHGA